MPGLLLRRLRPGGDLGRRRRSRSARATGCASCTATSAPTSCAASPPTATWPTTWAAAGGVTGGKDGNMHFGDPRARLRRDGLDAARHGAGRHRDGARLQAARRAARGDDLLRRGLDRERPVARGDELRRRPPAAGRLRAREQPVRLLDPERARVRGRPGRARRRPTASPGSSVDGNDVEAVFEAAARGGRARPRRAAARR